MRHAEDRGRSWFRVGAFTPFLLCIVIILVGLGWLVHKSRARAAKIVFEVEIDGLPSRDYSATLNGLRYRSGEPSGLGKVLLAIAAPDAEPFQTNLNIGYSGVDLGLVALPRSQGTLAFQINPSRNKVFLTGLNVQREFQNVSNEVLRVPVGAYQVVCKFEHFELREGVVVRRNENRVVRFNPETTDLAISSEPPDSKFELWNQTHRIKITGVTPAKVTDLPVDQFTLQMSRENFRKASVINLAQQESNTVNVTFAYAQVRFASEPANAEVRMGNEVLGRTPFSTSFAPGEYEFQIARDEFFPKELRIKLSEGAREDVSIKLENIAFAKALRNARSALDRFDPEYEVALREIESALAIEKTDEAIKLKSEIMFQQKLSEAKNLARRKELDAALIAVNGALQIQPSNENAIELRNELEAANQKRFADAIEERRQLPSKVFAKEISGMRFHQYFETKYIRAEGDAAKVHADVLRALAKKPAWTIHRTPKVADGMYLVDAEVKGLMTKERVLILIDQQPGSSTSTVNFRLIDYVLGDKIQISFGSGVSEDSWQPLHSDFKPGQVVEAQRNRNIELFRQKLVSELKLP